MFVVGLTSGAWCSVFFYPISKGNRKDESRAEIALSPIPASSYWMKWDGEDWMGSNKSAWLAPLEVMDENRWRNTSSAGNGAQQVICPPLGHIVCLVSPGAPLLWKRTKITRRSASLTQNRKCTLKVPYGDVKNGFEMTEVVNIINDMRGTLKKPRCAADVNSAQASV